MIGDTVISVKGLSKCYHIYEKPQHRLWQALSRNRKWRGKEFWALKDVSFEIKRGESVGIIGRNGSGKSTLLQIITGILTPTSGTAEVHGRVAALLELGSGFNPEFTGRENIFLNGAVLGLSHGEIIARFDEIAAFADIGLFIDQPVKEYSSGMMMRLAFALQVNAQPDILIVDEALSVGDIFFQQKCLRRIKQLQETGTTLLFVSHDMSVVRDLCQKALYLVAGQPVLYGSKIEAIARFLRDGAFKECSPQISEKTLPSSPERSHGLLPHSLWENMGGGDGMAGRKASILSIAVVDEQGAPTTQSAIGGVLVFRVLYRVNAEEPIGLAFTLKNRYDQIVNISGTFASGAPPTFPPGSLCISEMAMEMTVEAGNYTFCFSLAEGAELNQGREIDSSPWLGPVQIVWNYAEQRAPFLGMFGIPYTLRVERIDDKQT